MEIKLTKDTEQKLITSLRRYMREEFGEDAGELKATLFLRFCLEEIGPSIYNQAIQDARAFMQEKVADLENVCYVHEGNHWKQSSGRRGR
ncbi:DUF2164 domain-containing protein [Holophaga foetida]|uniref:DUF2164 domain-containing protein n=1 Tax=Holophaga foetida TaxID=35839 RepID=UPI00024749E3|nr:DUF2164 domain-containing protein [Holophaga foetida]